MAKKTIRLRAEKNQVPQGAWLAFHYDSDTPESEAEYNAFTTASAAKRHLAAVVGRSRIGWTDVNDDGMAFEANVEVKN